MQPLFNPISDVCDTYCLSTLYWQSHQQPRSYDLERDFPLDGTDLDSVTDETLVTLLGSVPMMHGIRYWKAAAVSYHAKQRCSNSLRSKPAFEFHESIVHFKLRMRLSILARSDISWWILSQANLSTSVRPTHSIITNDKSLCKLRTWSKRCSLLKSCSQALSRPVLHGL